MVMELMTDGFPTKITLVTSGITLAQETSVTPPGVAGGGGKATTNMYNTRWRTQSPKKLADAKDINLTVQYDPGVYAEIIAALQDNQEIEIEFPDETTLTVWGWLEEFTPGELVEGEVPTADIVIMISNRNGSGAETAPVWADVTP